MAITKLGTQILTLQKRASMWSAAGKALGSLGNASEKIMNVAWPGLIAFDMANGVASGTQSVGGALGSAAGMQAAYSLSNKGMQKIFGKRKFFGKGALDIAAPMAASMLGSGIGEWAGNAIAPMKRMPRYI